MDATGPIHQDDATTPRWLALWLGVALFSLLASLWIFFAPPLFDFDGYMYRLNGLAPAKNVNPAHLLWVPMQALFWRVFGWLHLRGTVPFQIVGILITALACAIQFRLLARRREDLALAMITAVFIATSPQVWRVAPLNQPYPSLFLLEVLLLAAWQGTPSTAPALVGVGLIVCLGALLHEAAVLWAGAVACLIFFLSAGSAKQRLQRSCFWGLSVGATILIAYAVAAVVLKLRSLKDVLAWVASYASEEHGLWQRGLENVVKCGFGFLGALVQLDRPIEWIEARATTEQLLHRMAMAEGVFIFAVLLLALRKRGRAWIAGCPWRQPLFLASLSLGVSWAFFCLIWEPANSKFWAVSLFPLSLAAILACQSAPRWTRYAWMIVLSAAIVWNLCEDHAADLRNAARFPDPQLARIRLAVRSQDRFVVLQRAWEDQVDYDLLLECLAFEGRTNATALVEKYFAARPSDWETIAEQEIDDVLKAGGRVFVSNLVFNPESYQNLSDEGPLSPYAIDAYKAIEGPALYQRVERFFEPYDRRPSELQLGNDRFWVITSRKNPRQTAPIPAARFD